MGEAVAAGVANESLISSPRSVQVACMENDPLTALTLAPPGNGGGNGAAVDSRPSSESVPAGFWDVMRDVIAREVREYVSSTFSENSGFHSHRMNE